MSLSGEYQDFHLEMFKDNLEHELQQRGTLLMATVTPESVSGIKNYFTKVGKLDSREKNDRAELTVWQDATYERRQIDFKFMESAIIIDVVDIMNMVKNPQSDYAMAMRNELGRKLDDLIIDALEGSATVITNGSSASTALPSASKIDVNDHAYDSGTGDVKLTPGKLKHAIANLGEAYVDVTTEEVFCVAPMSQLMHLLTNTEVVSADYRNTKPLDIPGLVRGLDGYLGLRFIAHERLGVDSNSDDIVLVYPKSAVKLGVRQPLKVTSGPLRDRMGDPNGIKAFWDAGAVRMFEEKVQQIACDPVA